MISKKSFRRTQKVINPKFQLQLAAAAVVFLLIYSFVLGAAIFYPLAVEYSSATDDLYKTQLAFTALKVHESLWPALICISVLAFIGTVLFSHRIAGPMYRFAKTIEELSKGNFKIRTQLRKRDEFHDFAEKLNTLSSFLEQRDAAEQSFRHDCEQLLHQMAQKMKSQNSDASEELQPIFELLRARNLTSSENGDSQSAN